MAAFSYQEEQHRYPPYLLDSSINCIPSSFPCLFSFDSGSSSSSSHYTTANAPSADDENLVFSPPASLPAETRDDDDDKAPNQQEHDAAVDVNKRKSVDETDRFKDNTNGAINKSRRQIKRPRGVTKKAEEKKKKSSKACSNPSDGYVHVRARRGQATDSHSLAERVRREKISERMKMLQGLVPGCDKVTGKALMLDEIINYVQSLQNQVEFLSMKIASLSPVLYDFKVNFADCTDQPQKVLRSIPQALPSVEQTNHLQAKSSDNGTACYQVMDHSTPHLMHVQGPTLSYSQDHGATALQVGAQRQGFQDQLGFLSICPFQYDINGGPADAPH